MNDYLNWLLDNAYVKAKHVDRHVNWFTFGLLLGALLIYFF